MSKKRKGTGKYSVYGAYNLYGYAVYEMLDNGYVNTLYVAGNARYESTTYVPLNSPAALDLQTIREMCEQTTKEMALEQGAKYTGIEYDKDSAKEELPPY